MKNKDNVLSNLLSSGKKENVGQAERVVSGVAGGALVAYGLKAGGLLGATLSLLGGSLLYRGATGHCQMYEAAGINTAGEGRVGSAQREANPSNRVHVKKSVTIDKSAAELYSFWRNFENLPQFMTHLESVKVLESDGKRSHWVAKAPLGQSVEWDAELTSDVENERIGWKSIEGSQIANSGVVEFLSTSNRGTEVRVVLTYEPPAGYVGTLIAKLFGEEPN
ncbi:MAG TPA: SRPBCC family protein, partial [Pyrinomonadaceae bacterium]|nr:SRPBCC family protein [Pyrinomonadaceae bacterium]